MKENSGVVISLPLSKTTKGVSPGLMSPYYGRISVNSMCALKYLLDQKVVIVFLFFYLSYSSSMEESNISTLPAFGPGIAVCEVRVVTLSLAPQRWKP